MRRSKTWRRCLRAQCIQTVIVASTTPWGGVEAKWELLSHPSTVALMQHLMSPVLPERSTMTV